MRKRTKDLAIGAAFAAGVGYLAGILTAPKSGKETRKDIENEAKKVKNEAERRLKELHSELDNLIIKGKGQASDAKSTAKKELEAALDKALIAKKKAREILSAFHEGETEDRELKTAIDDVNKALAHLKKFMKD
jgi:gas vesicle protein